MRKRFIYFGLLISLVLNTSAWGFLMPTEYPLSGEIDVMGYAGRGIGNPGSSSPDVIAAEQTTQDPTEQMPLSREFKAQLLDYYFPKENLGEEFLQSDESIENFLNGLYNQRELTMDEMVWLSSYIQHWEELPYSEQIKQKELDIRNYIYSYVYNLKYPVFLDRYEQDKRIWSRREIPLPNFDEKKELYMEIERWAVFVEGGFPEKIGIRGLIPNPNQPTFQWMGNIKAHLEGNDLVIEYDLRSKKSEAYIMAQILSKRQNFEKYEEVNLDIFGGDGGNYEDKNFKIYFIDSLEFDKSVSIDGLPYQEPLDLEEFTKIRLHERISGEYVHWADVQFIKIYITGKTEPLSGKIVLKDFGVKVKERTKEDIAKELYIRTSLLHSLTPSGIEKARNGELLDAEDVARTELGFVGYYDGPLMEFINPIEVLHQRLDRADWAVVNQELERWIENISDYQEEGMNFDEAVEYAIDKITLWAENEDYLREKIIKINRFSDTFAFRHLRYQPVIDAFNEEVDQLIAQGVNIDEARKKVYLGTAEGIENKTHQIIVWDYLYSDIYYGYTERTPIQDNTEFANVTFKWEELKERTSGISIVPRSVYKVKAVGTEEITYIRKNQIEEVLNTTEQGRPLEVKLSDGTEVEVLAKYSVRIGGRIIGGMPAVWNINSNKLGKYVVLTYVSLYSNVRDSSKVNVYFTDTFGNEWYMPVKREGRVDLIVPINDNFLVWSNE